jgi:hypothetical protein
MKSYLIGRINQSGPSNVKEFWIVQIATIDISRLSESMDDTHMRPIEGDEDRKTSVLINRISLIRVSSIRSRMKCL